MTERERLIEIINSFDGSDSEELADLLLANDVVPLPVPLGTSKLYDISECRDGIICPEIYRLCTRE